jgi:preprotein translocase subunit YajC
MFLISDAYAGTGTVVGGFDIAQLTPLAIMVVAFWFLLIRPQQKAAKEKRAMIAALTKNDEVLTTGGLVGRVSKVHEQFLSVEIANGVEVQILRSEVNSKLDKGTYKPL